MAAGDKSVFCGDKMYRARPVGQQIEVEEVFDVGPPELLFRVTREEWRCIREVVGTAAGMIQAARYRAGNAAE